MRTQAGGRGGQAGGRASGGQSAGSVSVSSLSRLTGRLRPAPCVFWASATDSSRVPLLPCNSNPHYLLAQQQHHLHYCFLASRHVDITLDGALIFSGELQQAAGTAAEALQRAEAILFTDSPEALERVEQHDAKYLLRREASPGGLAGGRDAAGRGLAAPASELDLVTAVASPRGGPAPGRLVRTVTGGRPLTAAEPLQQQQLALERIQSGGDEAAGPSSSGRCGSAEGALPLLRCRRLLLAVLDTYGDSHFCGLSGLEVVGADGQPVPLAPANVWADPPDLNVFPGGLLSLLLTCHGTTAMGGPRQAGVACAWAACGLAHGTVHVATWPPSSKRVW